MPRGRPSKATRPLEKTPAERAKEASEKAEALKAALAEAKAEARAAADAAKAARSEAKAAVAAGKGAQKDGPGKAVAKGAATAFASKTKAGEAASKPLGKGKAEPKAQPKAKTKPAEATADPPEETSEPKRKVLGKAAAAPVPVSTKPVSAKPQLASAAPANGASRPVASLRPGDSAVLTGLEKCPDLNGAACVLIKFHEERERWEVSLAKDGSCRNVREANLARREQRPPKAPPGVGKRAAGGADEAAPKAKAARNEQPKSLALSKDKAEAKAKASKAEAKSEGKAAKAKAKRGPIKVDTKSVKEKWVAKDPKAKKRKALEATGRSTDRDEIEGKQDEKVENVTQLLRKLVAEAEMEQPNRGGVSSLSAVKDTAADAELAAAEAIGDDAGDLDGEDAQKGRKKPEDALFDGPLLDGLEGEEALSEHSGIEEQEDDEEEDDDFEWEPVGEVPYPKAWPDPCPVSPGHEGFNAFAAGCISKGRLGTDASPFAHLGMRLHQESAAFLVHPQSPVQRLLVDHATGTGKTLIMLRILDNYFDDPRPKVAIFPKDRVCDNFYRELLKWPTRWREYFAFMRPEDAQLACGYANWKKRLGEVWDLGNTALRNEAKRRNCRLEKVSKDLVDSIRDVLEMKHSIAKGTMKPKFAANILKEHPGIPVPRAPLRAFRYTTAGGGAAELGDDGWPNSPILKLGFDKDDLNPYSSKVAIMDECHNLVRPCQAYEDQLGRLRGYLAGARNIVLAGFTGTPVGNDATEGRNLLDVIKGEAAEGLSDEGYVSSFHARGSADFPREVPVAGIPDGILHEGMLSELVVRHSLHGEALKRYLLKEADFQTIPRLIRMPEEKRTARLSNYCNMHVHYGSYHSSNRTGLLSDSKGFAPKFHCIAKAISKSAEKCVVMLSREMGFKALLEVLQKTGKASGFKVATMDELGDFNDARKNLRGERFRVLAAETNNAGEGVQFRHVRRIYLVDVPLRHSDLVQRCSRCVRMGGHAELPAEERSITVEMHVAQLPKFLRSGPSSLVYRELLNAKDVGGTTGAEIEEATEAVMQELKSRNVKTLPDLQVELQKEDGEKTIDLLTETALEKMTNTAAAPARPLAMALWRLRKGGDDLQHLEDALMKQGQTTADELLVEKLIDKSAELLPPLAAMRFGAVDRTLLSRLGDPPAAPPPRTEAMQLRIHGAKASLKSKKRKTEHQGADASATGAPDRQAAEASPTAQAAPAEPAEPADAAGALDLAAAAQAASPEEASSPQEASPQAAAPPVPAALPPAEEESPCSEVAEELEDLPGLVEDDIADEEKELEAMLEENEDSEEDLLGKDREDGVEV